MFQIQNSEFGIQRKIFLRGKLIVIASAAKQSSTCKKNTGLPRPKGLAVTLFLSLCNKVETIKLIIEVNYEL